MIMLLEGTDSMQLSSSQFYLKDLGKDMGTSSLSKQVMIDQIIGLQKSVAGSSAENLISIFKKLNLSSLSLAKLKSFQWNIKAQGISELGQMLYTDSIPSIKSLINHRNQTVREEALMAMVKLDQGLSLSFLHEYYAPLSPWIAMRIFQHLSNSDKRNLPDFSQWFNHTNSDVVLFAIEMTKRFRQLNSGSKLVELLDKEKTKITAAIETLGELEIHDQADKIVACAENHWEDIDVSRKAVTCLGKIGYSESHWSFMAKYLSHPDYSVRFEAARALNMSGNGAKQRAYKHERRNE
ncbi:MAG: HEAT repeat domain-containing protein [Cyclobacteriaceae bacterium]